MTKSRGVRCVALDFGGTIAAPGPSPHDRAAVDILEARLGRRMPSTFVRAVGRRSRQAHIAYVDTGKQTHWEEILGAAALETGVSLPPLRRIVQEMWEAIPDGVVDAAAAQTVRALSDEGYTLILACNTRRPPAGRRRTLAAAGIQNAFAAMVMSSDLGVCKPSSDFFNAVAEAASTHAGAGRREVAVVGDSLERDVHGALAFGMRAVLIGDASFAPPGVPSVRHLAQLPGLLRRWP